MALSVAGGVRLASIPFGLEASSDILLPFFALLFWTSILSIVCAGSLGLDVFGSL